MVEVLLKRNDVDPNKADTKYDRTPLVWVARARRKGMVEMLLERGDVDPNAANAKYGQTPLSRAAENGHAAIVRILLERSDINPNTSNTPYGSTSLRWVAGDRHQTIATPPPEPAGLVPKSAASLPSTEPFSPESSRLPGPPSKRRRMF